MLHSTKYIFRNVSYLANSWYTDLFSARFAANIFNKPLDNTFHYDVIKWKYFSRYCPFVRGIPRS